MIEEVKNYIATSKPINELIKRIASQFNKNINRDLQNDFIQHFYLQMFEMSDDKLIKAYNEGYIDKLCTRVATNLTSKTSNFYKEYLKHSTIEFINHTPADTIDISQDLLPLLKKAIGKLERNKKKDFLQTNLHLEIIRLYYYDGLTLKQIESKTGVDYNTTWKSLQETKKYLKSYIKYYLNNDTNHN